jgi:3D (Asp-Asp-Asp) domain-containing protein
MGWLIYFAKGDWKVMTRKLFLITATVFILLIMIILNLAVQLQQAKKDAIDAREMVLESEAYEVQLMNITMYAPLSASAVEGQDYSGDPSQTASGDEVVPGETAAAGPNIPFGTRIYVEGLGWRTVNDRGRLVGPNNIDLAVPTKEESLEFGKQQRLVILHLP